jgi:CheY-like chemotaxis protein
VRNQEDLLIVMADDDDDDCLLARDAFEESKVPGVLHCVGDGVELLDFLSHAGKYKDEHNCPCPALILLDLNMPRKDGRQALREIKSTPAFQNIPVVVLTTSQEQKDLVFSREMGAESFITKPALFDAWIEMMKSLAENWLKK